jgi:phosphatidylglycerophosphate synthase
MLDAALRKLVDPLLTALGKRAVRAGVGADQMTGLALFAGLGCAAAITIGQMSLALLLLALGRLGDGLDGTIARQTRRTDRGGFIDIVADFAFYGAVVFAFAAQDPGRNALPAAFLLLTFYVNGATFLAYAAVAAGRGMTTELRGPKSIYFTAGLAEGGETIAAFALMMLWPAGFPVIAWVFGAMCLVTAGSRVLLGWRSFA